MGRRFGRFNLVVGAAFAVRDWPSKYGLDVVETVRGSLLTLVV